MARRSTKLVELSTYVEPTLVTKIIKKRGKMGLISHSAYLRVLIQNDLDKK